MSGDDRRALFRRLKTLRAAGQTDAALAALQDALRRGALGPGGVDKAGRWLARALPEVHTGPLRVLLLGQLTTTWLVNALIAEGWSRGLALRVGDGDYDSVLQEAIALADREPVEVVVLLPWTQRLLGGAGGPGRSGAERVEDELAYWAQVWGQLARRSGLRVIQVGYDWVGPGPLGAGLSGREGPVRWIRALNQGLLDALPEGFAFLDLAQVAGEVGRSRFYAPRRYHWTRQPFSELGVVALARHLSAALQAALTGPAKVLVLDLDNTLWGGVVGEEGPLGVALGDSAEGEAYRAFQGFCKALSARGVLLAVSSKNNRADAEEPFRVNPDMVLSLDDFAAFEADWSPKAAAIERIAATLNLGLDSVVFFDDNPAEREQVRQALPMVQVVEVPGDPAEYVRALEAGLYFESVGVTEADRRRADQYRTEAKRRTLQSAATSLDDYYASLAMRGCVRPIDEGGLSRALQLIGKTNQFNLTTRRHPRERVVGLMADPAALALTCRVWDRFGDHGVVSVILGAPCPGEPAPTLRLDTWLMSCRVIARTVEHFVFEAVLREASRLGYQRLIGEYLPTQKNSQVADLYDRLGFEALDPGGPDGEGARRWVLRVDGAVAPPHFVSADDPQN